MREIVILAVYPQILDTTSWYRGARVMGQLRRQQSISLVNCTTPQDWPMISACDILFLQRPFNDQHVLMMQLAKTLGVKVWIDYDDDLFSVPMNNGAWITYAVQKTRDNIKYLQANADVVTVTTNYMAAKIENPNVKVIPNAYDDIVMHRRPQHEVQSKKVIYWRGTDTHAEDLVDVAVQIKEVAKNNPDWGWFFAGWNPWPVVKLLREVLPQESITYQPFASIFQYLINMQNLAPSIMMFPLTDNPFNRSKSNCAWLEGTNAGAAVIAPKWEEWDKPGVTCYTGAVDFGVRLQKLIDEWSPAMSEISWSYIKKNLLLSDVTKKRRDIVQELMGVELKDVPVAP